jgi:hypothetical protein
MAIRTAKTQQPIRTQESPPHGLHHQDHPNRPHTDPMHRNATPLVQTLASLIGPRPNPSRPHFPPDLAAAPLASLPIATSRVLPPPRSRSAATNPSASASASQARVRDPVPRPLLGRRLLGLLRAGTGSPSAAGRSHGACWVYFSFRGRKRRAAAAGTVGLSEAARHAWAHRRRHGHQGTLLQGFSGSRLPFRYRCGGLSLTVSAVGPLGFDEAAGGPRAEGGRAAAGGGLPGLHRRHRRQPQHLPVPGESPHLPSIYCTDSFPLRFECCEL